MKKSLSLTQQLSGTLALGTLALLLVGILGMLKLQQSQERFDYNASITYPCIHQMADLTDKVNQLRINVLYLASVGKARRADLDARAATLDAQIDKIFAQYQSNYDEQDVRMIGQSKVNFYQQRDPELLRADLAALKSWRAERVAFVRAAEAGDSAAMDASFAPFSKASDALTRALQAHMQMNFDLAEDVARANQANYLNARNLMLGLIVASVLLTTLFGIRMVRSMRGSLLTLKRAMQTVKENLDLTARAPVERQDEIGETSLHFNALLEQLQHNLRDILQGADHVARLAGAVTDSSNKVRGSSTVQSEASAAMAAAIEEMTVSINHVAARARATQEGARLAGEKAEHGASSIGETIRDIHDIAAVMGVAVESIRKLDEESNQVVSVVQIIREIAEQTNLLALNAAIEAARAGEFGRGFAVVADEVRKLAERTSQSTLEIGSTLTRMREYAVDATTQMGNVEKLVQTGEQRADQADRAMHEIGAATKEAAAQVDEISTAISEQGMASESISVRVEQVAGMAAEADQASEESERLSRELDGLAREQIRILHSYTL